MEIREAMRHDFAATRHLVRAAFHDNEPEETAAFLDALRDEGCVLGEWLAEDASGLLAHIVFSRVWVEADCGARLDAAMLTPLAVRRDRQRSGVGTKLMLAALGALEAKGEDLFLVLGHPNFYPRGGFDSLRAQGIENPWGNRPAFMARCKTATTGKLILPKAIAAAH